MRTRILPVITAAAAALCVSASLYAQEGAEEQQQRQRQRPVSETVSGVSVSGLRTERNGNYMSIDMTLDLSNLRVGRRHTVLLTPCLANGEDSLHLTSVGIYGRKLYFPTVRNLGEGMLSGEGEMVFRAKHKPDTVVYHTLVPYAEWMEGMEARLHRQLYGCCEHVEAMETGRLGIYRMPIPALLYVTPKAETKERALQGTAYIDYPVDKTEIYPDYHNNPSELSRISATIDSVGGDGDTTITGIWLKGYASPESPYSHNKELAMGRVASLREYLHSHHSRLPSGVSIIAEYEPENWEGLRRYVELSTLRHREEILSLIDKEMDPDEKEAQMKAAYPEDYQLLLNECYPYLRRTDYRISYTVRGYHGLEEIREVWRTQPGKLSLNEMYLLSESMEPGSEEFNAVFETAVHLYPEDPVACLNAANAEMSNGELASARRHLSKAGDSGEADYARGVFAMTEGDYEAALTFFLSARDKGVAQASAPIEAMEANK